MEDKNEKNFNGWVIYSYDGPELRGQTALCIPHQMETCLII